MKLRIIFFLICAFAFSASSEDRPNWNENWPHWRGPLMNGAAPLATPPLEWSEEKNVKWKVNIDGEGSSTPIVWENRIFVLTAIQTDRRINQTPAARDGELGSTAVPATNQLYQFDVICYDRNSGDVIWRKTAVEQVPHEGIQRTNTYASGSPMTDGEHLYVSFGSRGIFCYSLDGDLIWERDLGDMQTRRGFGEGASPFIYDNSLIVPWDHEGPSALYCLNARNGETKWKVAREGLTNWNTPIVVEWEGTKQVIVNGVPTISYDLATGNKIWECGGQTISCIPTTIINKGVALCMSGWRGAALYAISLSARGDVTGSEKILWSRNEDTPYVPSALLYGERLYFTKHTSTILTCLNVKTGLPIINSTRLPDFIGTIYASPVGADDRVYILNRDGETLVIQNGDEIQKLALNKLDDTFNASPVMVGKQIILRGFQYLYCIEEYE